MDTIEEDDRKEAMAFGRRVREHRSQRSLSLEELATRAGVSRAMLSKVERGEKSPTIPIASKIARGLGLSLSLLVGDTEAAGGAIRVVRSNARRAFVDKASGFKRELLSPPSDTPGIEVVRHEIARGGGSGLLPAYPVGTWKFVYVEGGRLQIDLGSETSTLDSGDAAAFLADRPHSFTAAAGRGCSYILVVVQRVKNGPQDG
jgi:transcriptional regulator with XRE-family HTH domain